jgi:hypothetical protein
MLLVFGYHDYGNGYFYRMQIWISYGNRYFYLTAEMALQKFRIVLNVVVVVSHLLPFLCTCRGSGVFQHAQMTAMLAMTQHHRQKVSASHVSLPEHLRVLKLLSEAIANPVSPKRRGPTRLCSRCQ